jgi:cell wall-active antibiotic response 4TMS protein YvqF
VNGIHSTNAPPSFQVTPQLVFGLLIVFAGIIFTLDELGVASARNYLRYWPMALVFIGALKLLQARDSGGAFVGLLLVLAGGWLQAEELDIIHISLRNIWPIGLLLFGGYLVWQGLAAAKAKPTPPLPPELEPLPPIEGGFASGGWSPAPPPSTPKADSAFTDAGAPKSSRDNATMNVVAIMGGVSRGNNSPAFRRADLMAFMGGCEIDLRKAAINGEAVIDIFCMWGGIEIRVPEDWTVVSHIVPVMGGVEDKTRPPQSATAHRLTLRGLALMGGIEIKN